MAFYCKINKNIFTEYLPAEALANTPAGKLYEFTNDTNNKTITSLE
jgi:hypothetical protein